MNIIQYSVTSKNFICYCLGYDSKVKRKLLLYCENYADKSMWVTAVNQHSNYDCRNKAVWAENNDFYIKTLALSITNINKYFWLSFVFYVNFVSKFWNFTAIFLWHFMNFFSLVKFVSSSKVSTIGIAWDKNLIRHSIFQSFS